MVKQEETILTKVGKKELEDELKHLIEVERPKVIIEIKEAREQGDLSENAEFDAAREKQGQVEDRVQTIENILSQATIVDGTVSNTIRIGTKVTFKEKNAKAEKHTFTIVGTLEADPSEGKISNLSPIGSALIGKKKGDEVKIEAKKKMTIIVEKVEAA